MSETIGQQLKQAREARNLTFKKVTQATHIQAHFIEALEADAFDSFPSPVQARAFLRIYAEFLGLSLEDLIANQRLVDGASSFIPKKLEASNDQEQSPVKGPSHVNGIKLDREPHKAILPTSQNIIKSFNRHARPKHSRPNAAIETNNTIEQFAPDGVGQIETPPVGPINAETEELAPDSTQELFQPNEVQILLRGSQIIFSNIGKSLQQRRETLSLTLEEIENHIHVRKHYLHALEIGDFNHLPSSVQTRGMLSNYAHFLDMDVDALLLQYAEGLQIQRLERQPAVNGQKRVMKGKSLSESKLPTGLRRYFSMDVFVGLGLILILLVFVIWGTSRIFGLHPTSTPQPVAQSISDILAVTSEAGTATPMSTSVESGVGINLPTVSATAVSTIQPSGTGSVQVVLIALDQAFVRVTVDGKIEFQGRITAGKAYPFDGNTQIEVLTGNGAAVSVLFNQSDMGSMGNLGEVVNRIYTATSILNPTATFTPTPTITPIPSITPRSSPTLRASITPQATSEIQP
jgi:cytoskeletal protein RodZ